MFNKNSTKEKIRLYLGYAPGKTTALNGLLLRALGAELTVKMILFSKSPENTSESKVYTLLKKEFADKFDYFFAGESRIREDGTFRYFGDPDGWTKDDESLLEEGIKTLHKDISSGKYNIVCIDELTDLIYHKRISEETAKNIINCIHPNTTIAITGHKCPDWLKELASTIIEGKVEKHYKGSTKGIEW